MLRAPGPVPLSGARRFIDNQSRMFNTIQMKTANCSVTLFALNGQGASISKQLFEDPRCLSFDEGALVLYHPIMSPLLLCERPKEFLWMLTRGSTGFRRFVVRI